MVDYFKELWKKFIKFLQDKFLSSNKYDDFINDLYDEDILYDNDIDIIQNSSKIKMTLKGKTIFNIIAYQ